MRIALFQRGAMLLRGLAALTGSGSPIVVKPPSWRLRLSRWLVALSACALAFQAYAWLVVPWIEPSSPEMAIGGPELPFAPRGIDSELESLFASSAWERNNPMELKTQWGRLLFQKYERTENGIELHPCTILFHAPTTAKSGKRETRTIVLKTPNKAVLTFAGAMDLARAQMGKLKGALLEGQVQIYARETSPGAGDALRVVTRNIKILPTKIWTPHDVAFQYGSSRGSGRVLTIAIASKDESNSAGAEPSLVRNIKTLELVHVDQLHLDFPGKGLLGSALATADRVDATQATPESAPSNAPPSNATAVDVTCEGPFQFDFQKGVATLHDYVTVVRVNPSGEDDQLSCDKLLIFFTPPDASATSPTLDHDAPPADVPANDQTTVPKTTVPKLAIRRIEATGVEVVLQAPSVQTAARGQLLQYDFQTRRILLQDQDKALLIYGKNSVESARLEYELHANPKRLGRLWAAGPGVFRGPMGKQQQTLQATWRGTLELQQQDELHVLSALQGAEIKWGATGNFTADKFFVWLAEVPVTEAPDDRVPEVVSRTPTTMTEAAGPQAAGAGPDLVGPALQPSNGTPVAPLLGKTESATSLSKNTKYEIVPVKMLAQENVHAVTDQFKVETEQLEIWFDHPDSASPGAIVAQESAVGATPAAQETSPPTALTGAPDLQREVKRLELSGDQIRLWLWMVKPRPVVHEATVSGQVRLAQLAPIPTDPIPFLVTGDMLQLRTDQLDRSTIDVRGNAERPARVQAQGMLLESSNLHVSQRENLIRSEGPGRTRLPARANHDRPRAAGEHALSSNAPIWISWQGGMDFDGQLIRFMKQVEVSGIYTSKSGEQLYLRSIGDQLHATLNRYVEFNKTKKPHDLDVVELHFLGNVFTKNQTYGPDNAMISQDQMKARDLTLDRRTGQFNAQGPGWVTTTRIDKGELGNQVGAATPNRVAPTRSGVGGQEKLVYLRIDFQNAIQGNLDLREGEFVHRVRTVYGPVLAWDQTLDPDRRGGLGPQGIVMTCNQLKVAEMGTGKRRAIEMSAVGNTVVEGNEFLARADRLTYVEAKQQLILEGVGRNFATLQKRGRIGAKADEFQAEKIIYGVKSGQHEVFGAKSLNFNQIGSPSIPNARIR